MAYLSASSNPVTHLRRLRAANAPAAQIAAAKQAAQDWLDAGRPSTSADTDSDLNLPLVGGVSMTTLALIGAAAFFFLRKKRA